MPIKSRKNFGDYSEAGTLLKANRPSPEQLASCCLPGRRSARQIWKRSASMATVPKGQGHGTRAVATHPSTLNSEVLPNRNVSRTDDLKTNSIIPEHRVHVRHRILTLQKRSEV